MSATVLVPTFDLPSFERSSLELSCDRPRRAARRSVALPARAARPLRLTRRGRLLLTCTAASALTAAVVALTGAVAGATAGHQEVRVPAVHTVLAGQTMSSIATRWAPEQDWREVAAEIVRINGLSSMHLQAGQRLTLPDQD